MFPLGAVLFPGGVLPLHVFEERYRTMMAEVLAAPVPEFGVVLITRGSEVGGGDARSDVGTMASVGQAALAPDGRYAVLATGGARLHVEQWLPDDPFPQAVVVELEDEPCTTDDLDAARAAVRRVEALRSETGDVVSSDPVMAAPDLWHLCDRLPVSAFDRQRLLAAPTTAARARLLLALADELADDLVRLLSGGT
jgi:Lon protease-like protein